MNQKKISKEITKRYSLLFFCPLGNVRDVLCVLRNYQDLPCRDHMTPLFQGIQPNSQSTADKPMDSSRMSASKLQWT